MSGLRAMEVGLVAEAVPKESLDDRTDAIVASLTKAGPRALAATKAHLNAIGNASLHADVRRGAQISAEVIAGPMLDLDGR